MATPLPEMAWEHYFRDPENVKKFARRIAEPLGRFYWRKPRKMLASDIGI